MRHHRSQMAFTVVEMLVVISIIVLLVGLVLPAIGKARDQGRLTASYANLRNIAVGHGSYAAEWADRQFTLVNDQIASYGTSLNAFDAYYESNGGSSEFHAHPAPILGWGYRDGDPSEDYILFAYRTHPGDGFNLRNASLAIPINWAPSIVSHFGSFRLPNVQQFNQYVSGRFYDRVFYAPKDVMVLDAIEHAAHDGGSCFEDPGQYCDRPSIPGVGDLPVWSSYSMSPAAMFAPAVFAHDGWRDPWSMPAGMRCPSYSQALYPGLKTHVLEHHWLQNRAADCNPGFTGGAYGDCEPYYFNHSQDSTPAALFYDGHVESVGVRDCQRADGRMREQTGSESWGLWSKDTAWGSDGYLIEFGYDEAATSFHILTTDGIRGRDIVTQR